MHAIFFGLKRAWHGTLRVTRAALAAMGLTSARFDLLYAAYDRDPNITVTQRALRRKLGVNRTTVSRMLGSLEALGLLTREPSCVDRRTRIVRLTTKGRRCIRIAAGRLIRTGAASLAIDSAIAGLPSSSPPGARWDDDSACLVATSVLESFLRGMRAAYRDSATLYYPWHPDR